MSDQPPLFDLPPAAYRLELQEPEPDQVRAARKCAGHTQTQAGQLVGGTLRARKLWPFPPVSHYHGKAAEARSRIGPGGKDLA